MVKCNPCNPHVPDFPPKKFYDFRSRTTNLASRVKASTPAVITRDAPQAIRCQSS